MGRGGGYLPGRKVHKLLGDHFFLLITKYCMINMKVALVAFSMLSFNTVDRHVGISL
mgnify:CR=1 FL=1